MKKLFLIRHAKSSWDDFSIKDFDRPLNDRGKRDAPVMGKRLMAKQSDIDAFISSPALRAKTTAKHFIKSFDSKQDLVLIDSLYLATPEIFFQVISGFDDSLNDIAVFSHNDGITNFANQLTETRIDDMPTCAIFALSIDVSSWKDFRNANKEFLFFMSPKSSD